MSQTTQLYGHGVSLEDLVRRLQEAGAAGERERLEGEIHTAVAERLTAALVRRYARLEWADAEEIVSDALLELFRNPSRFDPARARLLTYLHLVVNRDAQNLLRKRDRLPTRIPLSRLGGAIVSADPEIPLFRSVLIARIKAVVDQLPTVTRRTMRLVLAGRTVSEIAEEMGCTPGTVRTRRSRGISMIRQRLADVPVDQADEVPP